MFFNCLLFLIFGAEICYANKSCNCKSAYQIISNHSMCLYKSNYCLGNSNLLVVGSSLSCAERKEILDLHNNLRNKLASGSLKGQPPARNMLKLTYSIEGERMAQCWAEQCIYDHDGERSLSNKTCGGQNIARKWSIASRVNVTKQCGFNFTHYINAWFNEYFDPGFPSSNTAVYKSVTGTKHYTQMAWAATRSIGCARVCFQDAVQKNKYIQLYVCNYYKCGNVKKKAMYKEGNPDCKAEGLQPSKTHEHLCDPIGPIEKDIPDCP